MATPAASLGKIGASIAAVERQILDWCRASEVSRRIETIPSIGVISASAIAATITDPSQLRSGRQLAAWSRDRATPERHRRQAAPEPGLEDGDK